VLSEKKQSVVSIKQSIVFLKQQQIGIFNSRKRKMYLHYIYYSLDEYLTHIKKRKQQKQGKPYPFVMEPLQ